MQNVLVVYASTHGHTGRIAARIADDLRQTGHRADLREVGDAQEADPLDYTLVIVGASVHVGRHQNEIAAWVESRADALNGMPSAFFSVSLSAADDSDEARERAASVVRDFELETGFAPQLTATFAGAIQYRAYGFFTKRVVRRIAVGQGHSGDARRDHVFTDWDAVETFAARAAALRPRARVPVA
jgi:menaquinone-dependent protoporphyrinogen oxidase